jgi:transcriptional regulator with XRE-family HTH domain
MQLKTRNYATLISELQQRLGLNQAEIAQKIGTTCLSISRWKNGHHQPSPMAIALLRQAVLDLGDRGKDLLKEYF